MRLWNRGKAQARTIEVVTDLDAILTRQVAFRFQGRTFTLDPLDTTQFFLAVNAIAECEKARQREKLPDTDLLDLYYGVFKHVCPQIKRKMLDGMKVQQVVMLFNTVCRFIMGDKLSEELGDAQKKSP